jgi:DNA-binding transcriptional ArsR family regulator
MSNNSLAQEINQLHARICSAISDPNRILLLYAVAEEPRNVNSLAEVVNISQSAASRHLKVLHERGLIQSQRDGAQVFYYLSDQRFIQALDLLREVMLDQLAQQVDLVKHNKNMDRGNQ